MAARRAITDTLYLRDDPAAAVVSINPANGAIRAMTAVTPGRTGNQFNLVAQARRQPGSTFKTFVLAAAINEGMNPDSTYYTSAPFHYQPDPYTEAWDVRPTTTPIRARSRCTARRSPPTTPSSRS